MNIESRTGVAPVAPTVLNNLFGAADEAPPRMLYSRKEAAYQLCISERALDYLVSKKEIAVRRMGKKILIPHAELVKFSRKDHDHLQN